MKKKTKKRKFVIVKTKKIKSESAKERNQGSKTLKINLPFKEALKIAASPIKSKHH